jgi:hypothetical protein
MSTTTPTPDPAPSVPVTLAFNVTVTTEGKADNAADVKRILDYALERVSEVKIAAGNGADAIVVGTVTIGKQKFKL